MENMVNENKRNNLKFFICEIADFNYFNNEQNIIRLKSNDKYFDFYYTQTSVIPNPNDYYIFLLTNIDLTTNVRYSIDPDEPRMNLIPGYISENKLSDEIPFGLTFLINKRTHSHTTNYNDTNAGMFNNQASVPSDKETMKYSISPQLNKNYTTLREVEDSKNENIGVFVTDNSVLLKSSGGSILLGPQGISFLGEQFSGNTKGGQGMMQDNPFSGWFPSTMMTVPLGIEYIPNYNFIIGVGTAATTLVKSIDTVSSATSGIQRLVG